MNALVEEYLAQAKEKQLEQRRKYLIAHGIGTKEYDPKNGPPSSMYPLWDEEKQKSYNFVPVEVTEEEWKAIEKAEEVEEQPKTPNTVAGIIKAIAIITYIVAFVCGILLGKTEYGDFSLALAIVYWIAGFVSGSMLLGFAEIINLLQDIKDKEYFIDI